MPKSNRRSFLKTIGCAAAATRPKIRAVVEASQAKHEHRSRFNGDGTRPRPLGSEQVSNASGTIQYNDPLRSTYEEPLPKNLWPLATTPYDDNGEPVKGAWHTYPEMAPAGLWTTQSDLARLAIEVQNE